jgi:hypothetical protein
VSQHQVVVRRRQANHPAVDVVQNDSLELESDILGPGRFRPGPPRNTKTTFGWFFSFDCANSFTSLRQSMSFKTTKLKYFLIFNY